MLPNVVCMCMSETYGENSDMCATNLTWKYTEHCRLYCRNDKAIQLKALCRYPHTLHPTHYQFVVCKHWSIKLLG